MNKQIKKKKWISIGKRDSIRLKSREGGIVNFNRSIILRRDHRNDRMKFVRENRSNDYN